MQIRCTAIAQSAVFGDGFQTVLGIIAVVDLIENSAIRIAAGYIGELAVRRGCCLGGAIRHGGNLAAISAAVAGLVELSRLYHSPGLDAFRLTPAGILLLGRVFDPWHFAVYWAAIALTCLADSTILRPKFAKTDIS